MKISIITITYNAQQWIERTLSSVLEQTYPFIEYIIIDGASYDKTLELIHRHDKKIDVLVSEPDKGIYDAMNKGLSVATGDYVWFINAGDTFYNKNTVSKVVEIIKESKTSPSILYGETQITNEKGEKIGLRRLRAPKTLSWKSFKKGMLVCHQSFIVKRSIAPKYNLQYKYSSDVDWCIRCMKKTDKILNTNLILSNFLDGGTSTQQRKKSLKERYQIMCIHYGKIIPSIYHIWFAIRFLFAKYISKRV